jgi:hypothetical protein
MSKPEERSGKKAKRELAQAIDSSGGRRNVPVNPYHIAYTSKRDVDIHHLTPRARVALGFEPYSTF